METSTLSQSFVHWIFTLVVYYMTRALINSAPSFFKEHDQWLAVIIRIISHFFEFLLIIGVFGWWYLFIQLSDGQYHTSNRIAG